MKALSLAYEEMARKLWIRFVDTSRWDIDLCYDGVHFTEKGHKAFAGKMAEIIIGLRIKVPNKGA